MKPYNRIEITLEGGLIQKINGIPPCTIVEVRDFDTEGCDDDELGLKKDEHGNEYIESTYIRGK